MRRSLIAGVALALALSGAAQAAPVLGSNVDSSVFSSAIGSTSGWSYLGQSTTPFTGTGTAELRWRSSNYADSFGYSRTSHANRVTLFNSGAAVGATAAVAGYSPGYLFYFEADGSDTFLFSDDNRQYTDGSGEGTFFGPGTTQGDMDIFYNAAMTMWAFFFDDAGGGGGVSGDDNDYDDMVVTFAQAGNGGPNGVPEPGTLGLLGASLLAIPALRRRRKAQRA